MDGNCDHNARGMAYDKIAIEKGPVTLDIRFTWDGVSTHPDCDGPILTVRVTNSSTTATWYVTLPRKRRKDKFVAIPPGTDVTLNGAALSGAGFDSALDVAGVGLHRTSTPPGGRLRDSG